MGLAPAEYPTGAGLEPLLMNRVGHFYFVAARIHRRPAGAIRKPASADDVDAAFNVIHLLFVERGHEALDLEVGECNFFLCHTIRRLGVNKKD